MAHDEGARLVQDLVPDVKRGADGRAGIVGGRLDVDVAEGRLLENLAVGDAVEGDPAGQAELLSPVCGWTWFSSAK